MTMPKSPYGGGPGTGLTIPPYFKPTPSVKSRNNYFSNSEKLRPDKPEPKQALVYNFLAQ